MATARWISAERSCLRRFWVSLRTSVASTPRTRATSDDSQDGDASS